MVLDAMIVSVPPSDEITIETARLALPSDDATGELPAPRPALGRVGRGGPRMGSDPGTPARTLAVSAPIAAAARRGSRGTRAADVALAAAAGGRGRGQADQQGPGPVPAGTARSASQQV